ncbi:MAG: hypothetical protein BWY74_03924 [Firmicutes bacterium ADurb.Bin419]|nr:MAG: hypothetical protein BWY74_03924 [Firmicutes bacterium ADurb.Bin419]
MAFPYIDGEINYLEIGFSPDIDAYKCIMSMFNEC